jgi:hypothetical protein
MQSFDFYIVLVQELLNFHSRLKMLMCCASSLFISAICAERMGWKNLFNLRSIGRVAFFMIIVRGAIETSFALVDKSLVGKAEELRVAIRCYQNATTRLKPQLSA